MVTGKLTWEELALRGARGDEASRKALVEELWPLWIQRVRTRKALRVLNDSEDHVHNVVARLVQKLLVPSTLKNFEEWRDATDGAGFRAWLFRVTDNEVLDYVRSIAGRVSDSLTSGTDEPSPKLLLNEFSSSGLIEELGRRPPNTELQTARELLEFAERCLPAAQTGALAHWLQGATDDELDARLQLPPGAGKALRRAAVARLRREFGDEPEG